MLLSQKLGMIALSLEASAFGGGLLFESSDDVFLVWYCLTHGAASVVLALFAIVFLPSRLAKPRWPILSLMALATFSVPVLGFIGVLLGVHIVNLRRVKKVVHEFTSLEIPEFDQHQQINTAFRQSGLRSFLTNSKGDPSQRMGSLVTLQYAPGKIATPLLRDVLGDASEDLRLLAYGLLDNQEKRITMAINDELKIAAAEQEETGEETPRTPRALSAYRRLSELFWELVYQELAQGDLRRHALAEASRYCTYLRESMPNDGTLALRLGRLKHSFGETAAAEALYEEAIALDIPASRVLPYMAQLHFDNGDMEKTREIVAKLSDWDSLPKLKPIIDFWMKKTNVTPKI